MTDFFLLKEDGDYLLLETGDKIILDSAPAIVYSVNGGVELDGIFAQWKRAIKRKRADGVVEYQPWAIHTWKIPQMDAANFLALQALQGQVLTELKTNNINFRNTSGIYSNAVMRLVNGRQRGMRVLDIDIEFRVDVS